MLTRDVASFEYLLIMSECRIGVITDSDNAGFITLATGIFATAIYIHCFILFHKLLC